MAHTQIKRILKAEIKLNKQGEQILVATIEDGEGNEATGILAAERTPIITFMHDTYGRIKFKLDSTKPSDSTQ